MTQRFVGLQILRFVAAMLVVVAHLMQSISIKTTGGGMEQFWGKGNAGVDIFFVISGFVMAASTGPSPSDIRGRLQLAWLFLKRRILRIVPLYWFYTLLKAALLVVLPHLAPQSSIDASRLATSLFFVPAMSPRGLIEPTLPVGWTLNFEMLFYAVFTIAIALALPRLRFCLLALLTVFLAGRYFQDAVPLAFYAQSMVFEFIFGMGIAYYFLRSKKMSSGWGVIALGIGALLMFVVDWTARIDQLFTWGIAAACMVLGVLWLEPWTERIRLAAPLSFLGDASYSIYLSHTFVVPAGVMALYKLGVRDSSVLAPLILLAVIVAGSLSYIWIERPMTKFLKRIFFKVPAQTFKPQEIHHAK
ncbi:MAG: acyltransferase [Polaromonas sp. 39-63-203]|uniref:acyltransferase family protein n=1 Tax=Polaromonas sp. TaxID=1869339 RepID=UPI000BC79513|nr:acyltransferase [Polaromonas sp.]OYY52055.1 MAG: acyltransferase [Polaromonas sp. 35-63-240]OYZ83504.1 MAG: acyltransferase [Polaromonas sp. 24-62-144]OZA97141.1 MAG: acyltransferase [Polaromonas sp. 39-63-203]HQS30645.1 acyltransferase [Polaromonas sp.]HQS90512.1 acyltransferase [Polaromonas sp.]